MICFHFQVSVVTAHIRFKMWFRYLVPAAVVLVALKYAQHDDVILPLTTKLNDSYDYIIGGLINQYETLLTLYLCFRQSP